MVVGEMLFLGIHRSLFYLSLFAQAGFLTPSGGSIGTTMRSISCGVRVIGLAPESLVQSNQLLQADVRGTHSTPLVLQSVQRRLQPRKDTQISENELGTLSWQVGLTLAISGISQVNERSLLARVFKLVKNNERLGDM